MGIYTTPKFYYDYEIDEFTQFLNIDEGFGELTVPVEIGLYTFTDVLTAVASALNQFGTLDYTVTGDRETRVVTISASAAFDILGSTGSQAGVSALPVIGFPATDQTGLTSYTGTTAGSEFIPQFFLQDYLDILDNKEANAASVQSSAIGIVEVLSFGELSYLEFDLQYITNRDQGLDSPIRTNLNGIADAKAWLDYIITKGDLEFMPDQDDPDTFFKILLERTATSGDGVGYVLREMRNKNLQGYFETGKLRFRKVIE